MTSPMTPARFAALAEAYGGEIARWPEAERDAAAALLAGEPDFAAPVLAQASGLDGALAQWPSMAASPALRETIIVSAPRPRRALSVWALRLGLGAGLAGACATGMAVGAVFLSGLVEPGGAAVSAAMSAYDDVGEASNVTGDV